MQKLKEDKNSEAKIELTIEEGEELIFQMKRARGFLDQFRDLSLAEEGIWMHLSEGIRLIREKITHKLMNDD